VETLAPPGLERRRSYKCRMPTFHAGKLAILLEEKKCGEKKRYGTQADFEKDVLGPMQFGDFEFSMTEFAGSMGDFGTLFPLAIGYIVVCGVNPAGLLIMMGLTNIVLGLVYKLPMPVEPKKVVAATAIAQKWQASTVYACGFGLGLTWIFLAATGMIDKVVKYIPKSVTRGIQLGLGMLLSIEGFKLARPELLVAALAVVMVFTLKDNRRMPAAVALMLFGLVIIAYKGQLLNNLGLSLSLPPVTIPRFKEVADSMLSAGIPQIPLSMTNAVIATAALIRTYFPDNPVSERRLVLNMGFMNLVSSFFGGMPMCHGAGGLAGQYYFGARTGGANIIEGSIEIFMGLLLGKSIHNLLAAFPVGVIGAMLFLVGLELAKFARKEEGFGLVVVFLTALISVAVNIAAGFAAGIILFYAFSRLLKQKPFGSDQWSGNGR